MERPRVVHIAPLLSAREAPGAYGVPPPLPARVVATYKPAPPLALLSPRRLLPMTPRTLRSQMQQQASVARTGGGQVRLIQGGDFTADVKMLLAFTQTQAKAAQAKAIPEGDDDAERGEEADAEIAAAPFAEAEAAHHPSPPSRPPPLQSAIARPSAGQRKPKGARVQIAATDESISTSADAAAAATAAAAAARSLSRNPPPPPPSLPPAEASSTPALSLPEPPFAFARRPSVLPPSGGAPSDRPLSGAASPALSVSSRAHEGLSGGGGDAASQSANAPRPRPHLLSHEGSFRAPARADKTAEALRRDFASALLRSLHPAGEEVPAWKLALVKRIARRDVPIRSVRGPSALTRAKLGQVREGLFRELRERANPQQTQTQTQQQTQQTGLERGSEAQRAGGAASSASLTETTLSEGGELARGDAAAATRAEVEAAERQRLAEARTSLELCADSLHDLELEAQFTSEKLASVSEAVVAALGEARQARREADKDGERRARCEVLTERLRQHERRASEAEAGNVQLRSLIRTLRSERQIHLVQSRQADERNREMDSDMRHFSYIALSSLDDGEKLELRLRRMEHDALLEQKQLVQGLTAHDDQIAQQDKLVRAAQAAEAAALEETRKAQFVRLRDARVHSERLGGRMGYLRAQSAALAGEFERLYRVMDVKFSPEEPQRVREIVSVFRRHEELNASLVQFLDFQCQQLAALLEAVRASVAEIAKLDFVAGERLSALAEQERAREEALQQPSMPTLISLRAKPLELLLEPLRQLLLLTNVRVVDRKLQLQGVRVDTILPLLDLLDARVRRLHARACKIVWVRGAQPLSTERSDDVLLAFSRSQRVLETQSKSAAERFYDYESESKAERELRMAALHAAGVSLHDLRMQDGSGPSAALLAEVLEREAEQALLDASSAEPDDFDEELGPEPSLPTGRAVSRISEHTNDE